MLEASSNHYTKLINPYILKNIDRYADRLTNIRENVAEHSFFTVIILIELLETANCNSELFVTCLKECARHDVLEAVLTDIPYSTKAADKDLREAITTAENNLSKYRVSSDVHHLIKIADILQVIQFITHEIKLGNKNHDILDIKLQSEKRLNEELLTLSELPICEDRLNYDLFLRNVKRQLDNEFFI